MCLDMQCLFRVFPIPQISEQIEHVHLFLDPFGCFSFLCCFNSYFEPDKCPQLQWSFDNVVLTSTSLTCNPLSIESYLGFFSGWISFSLTSGLKSWRMLYCCLEIVSLRLASVPFTFLLFVAFVKTVAKDLASPRDDKISSTLLLNVGTIGSVPT